MCLRERHRALSRPASLQEGLKTSCFYPVVVIRIGGGTGDFSKITHYFHFRPYLWLFHTLIIKKPIFLAPQPANWQITTLPPSPFKGLPNQTCKMEPSSAVAPFFMCSMRIPAGQSFAGRFFASFLCAQKMKRSRVRSLYR